MMGFSHSLAPNFSKLRQNTWPISNHIQQLWNPMKPKKMQAKTKKYWKRAMYLLDQLSYKRCGLFIIINLFVTITGFRAYRTSWNWSSLLSGWWYQLTGRWFLWWWKRERGNNIRLYFYLSFHIFSLIFFFRKMMQNSTKEARRKASNLLQKMILIIHQMVIALVFNALFLFKLIISFQSDVEFIPNDSSDADEKSTSDDTISLSESSGK